MAEKKAVLAIGIEPALADLSALPHVTPDLLQNFVNAELGRLGSLGFDVVSCLIDLGETAEEKVTLALQSRRFDCVVIGAGLRIPPQLLLLFEKVVNLVHRLAPTASICFNTTPADTAEAVQRRIKP